VRVEDHIHATHGVKWKVGDTRPAADKVTNNDVVWNNIGNIAPHKKKAVEVDISINANSAAGKMSDNAHVTGKCATGDGPGTANVNLGGNFTLHAPQVKPGKEPPLPDTGMSPLVPIGGGLLLAAGIGIAVIRRRIAD
jgi:LPXTG-motif cell wall-anchored protein